MKLISLKCTDFASFPEASFTFPASGLVLIRANNQDTGGASGAGKTNFLRMIAYALGYEKLAASKLARRGTKKSTRVQLVLQIGPDTYLIDRALGSLAIYRNGECLTENMSVTAADEVLSTVIPFDPEMLRAITYRPQKARSFFLSKTDAEKKDFLCSILGLDKIEQALVTANANRTELQQKISSLQRTVDTFTEQKANAEAALVQHPEPPDTEPIELEIKTMKEQIAQYQIDLNQLSQDSPEKTSIWNKLQKANADILAHSSKKSANFADIVKTKDRVAQQNRNLEALRDKAKSLIATKKGIEKDECPTCTQSWKETDPFKAESGKIQSQFDQVAVKGKQVKEDLAKAEADLVKYNAMAEEMSLQSAELESQRQQIAIQFEAIKGGDPKVVQQIERIKAQIADTTKDREAKQSLLLKHVVAQTERKARLRELETCTSAIGGYAQSLKEAQENELQESDFLNLLGRQGFLGSIFDEILQEISQETAGIVAQLPNVCKYTFSFESSKLTAKGIQKTIIAPQILDRGEPIDLELLSGGQEQAIGLAVDLAVNRVVSRRRGVCPEWLILDEALTGLDPITSESYLGCLTADKDSRLVLVIDHSSDSQEMFDRRINIVYKGGESSISDS